MPSPAYVKEQLRRPTFVLAALCLVLVVLIEIGAEPVIAKLRGAAEASVSVVDDQLDTMEGLDEETREDSKAEMEALARNNDPPGKGIPALLFIDVPLLFAVGSMVLALVIPPRIQGRVQGLAGLIVSILLILGGIVFLLVAIGLLLLMVAMFLAVPWGTLAYLAIYGAFDRGGATAALSTIMFLKLAFAVLLVVSQQRFLGSKSLVLLLVTSIVATILTSFLHGFVPIFLVSITDCLAAIISTVLGLVWAVVMLVFAVVGIVRALA